MRGPGQVVWVDRGAADKQDFPCNVALGTSFSSRTNGRFEGILTSRHIGSLWSLYSVYPDDLSRPTRHTSAQSPTRFRSRQWHQHNHCHNFRPKASFVNIIDTGHFRHIIRCIITITIIIVNILIIMHHHQYYHHHHNHNQHLHHHASSASSSPATSPSSSSMSSSISSSSSSSPAPSPSSSSSMSSPSSPSTNRL